MGVHRSGWLKPKGKKLVSDEMSDEEDDVVSSVPIAKPKVQWLAVAAAKAVS